MQKLHVEALCFHKNIFKWKITIRCIWKIKNILFFEKWSILDYTDT